MGKAYWLKTYGMYGEGLTTNRAEKRDLAEERRRWVA
jgi:hypothetical protein